MKYLDKIRDDLAKKYGIDDDWSESAPTSFKAGWDSAVKHLTPLLERLKIAEYTLNHIAMHGSPAATAYVKKWGIYE